METLVQKNQGERLAAGGGSGARWAGAVSAAHSFTGGVSDVTALSKGGTGSPLLKYPEEVKTEHNKTRLLFLAPKAPEG